LGVTENPTNNEETVTPEPEEDKPIEETSSVSQMQVDADYIKANYSFIKPLEGQITSRFGLRERVEPKYHTGIDIAEDLGFDIVAAMEGTVEFVSGEGNYGNHLKITNGEVSTLYAHCKTICVKQGEQVSQGQKIAEVGATGNVTGPHLHFEILRNGELVNPDLVLQF
jgi:murein DD-endopeptidase MepM/ murein hydrolase activator NlpD